MAYHRPEFFPWPRPPVQHPSSFDGGGSNYNNVYQNPYAIDRRYPNVKRSSSPSCSQPWYQNQQSSKMMGQPSFGFKTEEGEQKYSLNPGHQYIKTEYDPQHVKTKYDPQIEYNHYGDNSGHHMPDGKPLLAQQLSQLNEAIQSYGPVPKPQGKAYRYNRQHRFPKKLGKVKKLKRRKAAMVRFETLRDILTFVKDNKRAEMKIYDGPTMKPAKRWIVHRVMDAIRNNDPKLVGSGRDTILGNIALIAMFTAICDCNEYVLRAIDEGKSPAKELIVLKLPPAHVYLITNRDLEIKDDGDDQIIVIEDDVKTIVIDDDEDVDLDKEDASSHNTASTSHDLMNNKLLIKQEPRSIEEDLKHFEMNLENVQVKQESACDFEPQYEENTTRPIEEMLPENVIVKRENTTNERIKKEKEITPSEEMKIENVAVKQENTNEEMQIENVAMKQENTNKEMKIENVAVEQENTKTETENRNIKREQELRELFNKYLKEFFENSEFTEMRFLGAFDEIEQKVLDDFVLKLDRHLCRSDLKNDWLYDTLLGRRYAIQEDKHGGEKIIKM